MLKYMRSICRQQNSSSEDCEPQHAATIISNLENGKIRETEPSSLPSPRSIGNGQNLQQERAGKQNGFRNSSKREATVQQPDAEQNSGSSSSSGKVFEDQSPDTVLFDGICKRANFKQARKVRSNFVIQQCQFHHDCTTCQNQSNMHVACSD